MKMRSLTIRYSKKKAKQSRNEETAIQNRLDEVDRLITNSNCRIVSDDTPCWIELFLMRYHVIQCRFALRAEERIQHPSQTNKSL